MLGSGQRHGHHLDRGTTGTRVGRRQRTTDQSPFIFRLSRHTCAGRRLSGSRDMHAGFTFRSHPFTHTEFPALLRRHEPARASRQFSTAQCRGAGQDDRGRGRQPHSAFFAEPCYGGSGDPSCRPRADLRAKIRSVLKKHDIPVRCRQVSAALPALARCGGGKRSASTPTCHLGKALSAPCSRSRRAADCALHEA